MVIKESTCLFNSETPNSADFMRRAPSKVKGRVTTATVRIPISRAISAMTGAAPVPVPPPIPAVIKSISVPLINSLMRSRSSNAASLPISGLAPAPKPLVSELPNCRMFLTPIPCSACASVLAQMYSTPSMPDSSMCFTALPPPPPTPMTLITAPFGALSINSNMPILHNC